MRRSRTRARIHSRVRSTVSRRDRGNLLAASRLGVTHLHRCVGAWISGVNSQYLLVGGQSLFTSTLVVIAVSQGVQLNDLGLFLVTQMLMFHGRLLIGDDGSWCNCRGHCGLPFRGLLLDRRS